MLNKGLTVPTPGIWGMAATAFFTRHDGFIARQQNTIVDITTCHDTLRLVSVQQRIRLGVMVKTERGGRLIRQNASNCRQTQTLLSQLDGLSDALGLLVLIHLH